MFVILSPDSVRRSSVTRAPATISLDSARKALYNTFDQDPTGKELFSVMKRIQTLETRDLAKSLKTGGCGECQTSCQSACKTSCGLANQQCENAAR